MYIERQKNSRNNVLHILNKIGVLLAVKRVATLPCKLRISSRLDLRHTFCGLVTTVCKTV